MDGFKNEKEKHIHTIGEPEFLKIESVSPELSSCQIKVCYVGKNRNGSFISKDTLIEMAGTLPGVPIIGEYVEKKDDFGDHGEKVIMDGEGIHFEKNTRPYGFVPIGAKVWFQKFIDIDDFGNEVEHEYLMTEGFLWTTLYEEAKKALDFKGQSMELNSNTMKGYWSEDSQSGINFYIITDATISALCLLGDDVEPCFEGAAVADEFVKNGEFFSQLFALRKEISRFQINQQLEKGENAVEKELKELQEKYSLLETQYKELNDMYEKTKAEAEEEKKKKEEEDAKAKNALAQEQAETYNKMVEANKELSEKVAAYEAQVAELEAYKAEKVSAEKDAIIDSFSMLSEEDKADIVANKDNYTCEELKAQLAVKYFDVMSKQNVETKAENTATDFTLDMKNNSNSSEGLSDLAIALNKARKN